MNIPKGTLDKLLIILPVRKVSEGMIVAVVSVAILKSMRMSMSMRGRTGEQVYNLISRQK